MGNSKLWRVKPGKSPDLSKIDTTSTAGAPGDRQQTEAQLLKDHDELSGLQERLWAENRRSLLVVLQAMDTGGKDGTIRGVFSGVNPQGVRVVAFKAPTPEEMAHDFLWRIHRAAPEAGEMGVFNRSHYEDVGIVRVHKLITEKVWRERYDLINGFEHQLGHGGTVVRKFFLHISKDEQRKRLQARLDDPSKHWKFRPEDLSERKLWDQYMLAYQEAIEKTSTDDAPWYVIPADHKWYRNWAVMQVILQTLRQMDPQYPDPPDLTDVTIE